MREARSGGDVLHERIEGDRSGQVVERQVQAGAVVDQRVDLGVGLGARQVGIELGEDDLRHRQAERPRDLAGDELGDQRLRALAGAAELQHVQPVVVGLDDRRQRAAFAERRHVAGDANGPERQHRRIVARRRANVCAARVMRRGAAMREVACRN